MSSESKIANADVILCIDEDILWFQISMDNGQSVDMCQSFKDFAKNSPTFDAVGMDVIIDEIPKRLRKLSVLTRDFNKI